MLVLKLRRLATWHSQMLGGAEGAPARRFYIALCVIASVAAVAIDLMAPSIYRVGVLYPLLLLVMNEIGLEKNEGPAFLWIGFLIALGALGHVDALWPTEVIERGLLLGLTATLAATLHRQRSVQRELRSLAVTDPLTGLANRRKYLADAEAERQRASRYRRKFAVMMLDIDHFKLVNDRYGHPAGDQVLRALAKTCLATLRPVDRFARYGGEEFIAALPETSSTDALAAAERVRKAAADAVVRVDGAEIRFTVSIGVSEWLSSEPTIQAAIERADRALYRAKNSGRNQVCAELAEGAD